MSSQLLFLVNLPLSLALALGGSPVIFYCLVLRRQPRHKDAPMLAC